MRITVAVGMPGGPSEFTARTDAHHAKRYTLDVRAPPRSVNAQQLPAIEARSSMPLATEASLRVGG